MFFKFPILSFKLSCLHYHLNYVFPEEVYNNLNKNFKILPILSFILISFKSYNLFYVYICY